MTTKQKKVKLMKLTSDEPLDSRHKKLFESLAETRRKNREERFQDWLHTCNDDGERNIEFVNWFITDVKELIKYYKYDITNEKQFKDEVASFIYKLSK